MFEKNPIGFYRKKLLHAAETKETFMKIIFHQKH